MDGRADGLIDSIQLVPHGSRQLERQVERKNFKTFHMTHIRQGQQLSRHTHDKLLLQKHWTPTPTRSEAKEKDFLI